MDVLHKIGSEFPAVLDLFSASPVQLIETIILNRRTPLKTRLLVRFQVVHRDGCRAGDITITISVQVVVYFSGLE